MEQKEYIIAYGNIFIRLLAVFFHLINEALYLLLLNIPIALLIIFINIFLLKIFDNAITQYIFFGLLAALIIFDIIDLTMVIVKKPKVVLTDNYLYLKRSFVDDCWGIHKDKILLYSEILSCEPTWTSYGKKSWSECFLLYFYDREHEITITTKKKILGVHKSYIIPLINDEEFMDDLTERIELSKELTKQ